MMSRPINSSPGFGLNGLRSTSQLRRRHAVTVDRRQTAGVDKDPPALAGGDESEYTGRVRPDGRG